MAKRIYIDFDIIKRNARKLRAKTTDSEKLLWEQLRNRKFYGLKFLRQHPIVYKADQRGVNYFIADFYCDQKKAVIELDGQIHDETQEYDQFRDDKLMEFGINTLRINNDELINMDEVLQKIKSFLNITS